MVSAKKQAAIGQPCLELDGTQHQQTSKNYIVLARSQSETVSNEEKYHKLDAPIKAASSPSFA